MKTEDRRAPRCDEGREYLVSQHIECCRSTSQRSLIHGSRQNKIIEPFRKVISHIRQEPYPWKFIHRKYLWRKKPIYITMIILLIMVKIDSKVSLM